MDNMPLVTVITLVYNTGNYVVEALQSVQAQTYKNIQHILIDDCSKDNSIEAVEKWILENNYECEFIKHQMNMGVCKSLNDGLKIAKGKYVNFVSDDLFMPNKIEKQVEIFESSTSSVGFVYGDLQIIDNAGNIIEPSFYKVYLPYIPPSGNVVKYYFDLHPIHFLGAMIKKSVFEEVGFFDEDLVYEDWDMGLRIARNYLYIYTNEIVASWRKHQGQMTDVFWKDERKHIMVLFTEFNMFKKHLDLTEYKTIILKKMCERFKNLVFRNGLTWHNKILMSFILLRNSFELKFFVIFLLCLFNDSMIIKRLIR
jgi:glycosyltransferase involved in cell wall biosynthesis